MAWKDYYNAFASSLGLPASPSFSAAPDAQSISGAGMPPGELGVMGIGRTDVDDIYGNELNQYGDNGRIPNLVNTNEMLEPTILTPTRYQRYLEFDDLDDVELVAAALDTYASEASFCGNDGRNFKVRCSNKRVKAEVENLLFHQLKVQHECESWHRTLAKNGDLFLENVIDPNKKHYGILKVHLLSPDTMHRIETTRGRLIEFQQTDPGSMPDLEAVKQDIRKYNAELAASIDKSQAYNGGGFFGTYSHYGRAGRAPGFLTSFTGNRAIRFMPKQIVHVRIGKYRKGFAPYGVSVVYAVRRAARMLKLMEDAMLIYRLVRAPERRIFYIDVGTIAPHEAMTHVERIKNALKKRKIYDTKTGSIDERVNIQAQDEDYFLPTRPNSQTRVDTLPGGQNLGETSDVNYFQDKVLRGLKLPLFFLGGEDPNIAKITTSATYVAFAQKIESNQRAMEEGMKAIAITHLELRGFSADEIYDLEITSIPPNDYKETITRENKDARLNMMTNAVNTGGFSTVRALQEFMGYSKEEAEMFVKEWEQEKLRRALIELGKDPDQPAPPVDAQLDAISNGGAPPPAEVSYEEPENPEVEEPADVEEDDVEATDDEEKVFPSWLTDTEVDMLTARIMSPGDAVDQEEIDYPAE